VTICSVDCTTPILAGNSIDISTREIEFGDAILFSDQPLKGNFRSELIPIIKSKQEYSRFLIEKLYKYISTDYVLIVQWDGYVTSPRSWNEDFLKFDYIGAIWPWHNDKFRVGNGGFSLRSKKLLEAFTGMEKSISYQFNEDEIICRLYRPMLEKRGLKFATEQIANQFSYERTSQIDTTFGFHGLFNMWRHCSDKEIDVILDRISIGSLHSVEYLELMIIYMRQKNFDLHKKMYTKLINTLDNGDIGKHVKNFTNDSDLIKEILESKFI